MVAFAIVVACLVIAVQVDAHPPSSLQCHGSSRSSLTVARKAEREISAAVRRFSRFPVVDLERPGADQGAPKGAVEALTLTWGSCDGGGGDTFWVREGREGWRVLKRVGHWARAP